MTQRLKINAIDFGEVPFIIYFDDLNEFMKLAKQNNYTIFEMVQEEGILRKKPVRYLIIVISEFLIAMYREELK